ncbi:MULTISPECIES: GumC family protein [unclassified Coleofasciculus]|uniref:GumC family protein n=1 Tax=unclassified Coleofasciculus TaxID=2692782 RepID=UPI00187EC434|nr:MULTISPECIES: polysaccharide biosynthesis tyrosine autokinase [unclassified Coleofasciculus]MBE9125727.1 polysaccharide biosynthesis tyrosine autokinase [Coleofasciculus sp. LEGE 07081]MBE9147215.1 polysaccharide biosynthesis tyrosine autokinase [Coleofasciculus sp. LEGE 07092]
MGLNGDYQPLLPNRNGKPLSEVPQLYTKGFSEIEEDKLDLRQILAVARRRAFVIAGVAIAVTSGIVAKVLEQEPNYEGKFQLLVEPISGENKLDRIDESLKQSAGVQGSSLDYDTQVQVLWSPQVMTSIVEKIQDQYPEIDYNTLRSKLLISRLQQTKILEVRYQDSDPQKIQFILEQVAEGYVDYSKQEQQTSIRQGIQFVNDQLPKLQERVNKLQERLQTFRQQYNLVDPDTQGQLLTTRIGQIVQQRQETESQLSETQSLYINLQNQLAELGVSQEQALTAAALSEAPRYQELLNQLSELDSKIAIESARFTDEAPTLQALREKRQNLLPLLDQEASTVLGNQISGVPSNTESLSSPSSIRLTLTQELVDTKNQLQVLQARATEVVQAERLATSQLKQLPGIARRYTDLQRELKVATESLNRFLAVRETLQIESAQKTLPWQLLAMPQLPEAPISPNIPRGLALATVAGLLAGAGAGLLAEKLDNVFHSADELKDSTGLPLLGTIPFRKDLKKGIIRAGASSAANTEALASEVGGRSYRYHASPFLEEFRSLHANLHFLSPDQPIRSLVVSSSVPADGKSTTATFLAQAAAAMGQRVLLVDADLRRPQIHTTTDLPNVWGLSNVISSEMNVDDVIQQSSLEDNLFVLTAGQIPPDPTRLLCSQKMRNLVERFQETFDLIIFDTPPLLGLADARLLAAHTDGIVMVVGLGRTDRAVLSQVLYGLRTSNARVLGVVANGVKGYTASSYDYYRRYYGRAAVQETMTVEG